MIQHEPASCGALCFLRLGWAIGPVSKAEVLPLHTLREGHVRLRPMRKWPQRSNPGLIPFAMVMLSWEERIGHWQFFHHHLSNASS